MGHLLDHELGRGHLLKDCVSLLESSVLPQLNLQYDWRDTDVATLLYVQGGWPLLYAFAHARLLPHAPFLKNQQHTPMPFNLYGTVHSFVLAPYLASMLTPTQMPMYLLIDEAAMLPWLCLMCGKKGETPHFVGLREHAPPPPSC